MTNYLTSRGKFEHLKLPPSCDSSLLGLKNCLEDLSCFYYLSQRLVSDDYITISCLDFAGHLLYFNNCAWLRVTMARISQ